jgi:hypothetical protein
MFSGVNSQVATATTRPTRPGSFGPIESKRLLFFADFLAY